MCASPPRYVNLTAFARDRALGAGEAGRLAAELGLVQILQQDAVVVLSPASRTQLKDCILDSLRVFHADNPDVPGIGVERLRLQLQPRLAAPVFASALQAMARAKEVALDGALVRWLGAFSRSGGSKADFEAAK